MAACLPSSFEARRRWHLRITAPGPESINFLFSEFQGTCGKRRHLRNAFQQLGPLIYGSLLSERRRLRRGTEMTDSIERAIDPAPVHPAWLLGEAFNNLSLGLIICDKKYEVVFCNKRYIEIYGLSSEQVKPGTPVRELIQHRLNIGFKVLSKPEEYDRGRSGNSVVPGTTVHQYTDGRIISFTVYPL